PLSIWLILPLYTFLFQWEEEVYSFTDIPFLVLSIFHWIFAVILLILLTVYLSYPKKRIRRVFFVVYNSSVSFLLFISIVLTVFFYVYALNANMPYAQRFAEYSGRLLFEPDTLSQRFAVFLKYMPFVISLLFIYVIGNIVQKRKKRNTAKIPLLVIAFSALLFALSFPSFLSVNGFGYLSYVALIPFLYILLKNRSFSVILYTCAFGVFFNLFSNYWLATYELLSFQFSVFILGIKFLLFGIALTFIFKIKISPLFRSFLVAAAWTGFDWVRSLGFFGFPWGFAGAAQYGFLPLIQIASITGVWGITFIIVFINAAIAEILVNVREKALAIRKLAIAASMLFLGSLAFGIFHMHLPLPESETVTIALIQQNQDPRQTDYRENYEVLRDLTISVMDHNPDLVVWPETGFVPSIRYYSAQLAERSSRTRLVHEFRDFQDSLDTYLITGNDDWNRFLVDGEMVRQDYNAAVFLGPDGEIEQVYQKIKLVPFTEHFPYGEQFPWVQQLLDDFGVNRWYKGEEQLILEHPQSRIATPICYEDMFPNYIRGFVQNGTELIVNISNDYWSLTEVEGMQHFIHSVFRAVENGRPMLRATASGVTASISPNGFIEETLPFYEVGTLVAELEPVHTAITVYTRFGDWFPLCSIMFVFSALLFYIIKHLIFSEDKNVLQE
ncbi:MAG: apolipoprotein N-acyltransferase, partial [Spirochaetia bacterium]